MSFCSLFILMWDLSSSLLNRSCHGHVEVHEAIPTVVPPYIYKPFRHNC